MRSIAAHIDEFEPEIYIQALVAVASCDGMTDDELEFIKSQAQMLGVDPGSALAAPVMVANVSRSAIRLRGSSHIGTAMSSRASTVHRMRANEMSWTN